MKLSPSFSFGETLTRSVRRHGGDTSAFVAAIKHNRLLGEDGGNSSESINSACDGISAELFGEENSVACQCSFTVGAVGGEPSFGGDESSDGGGGVDVKIDCREGDAEIVVNLEGGKLSFMETCGLYCDEGGTSNCDRMCVGDTYWGGSDVPSLCVASMGSDLCNSCRHGSFGFDFGSSWNSWNSYGCPDEDRIDLDCSNIGGRDYKKGHMCGQGGNVTFEVETYSSHGQSGLHYTDDFIYSGDSYSSRSSSSSSSDTLSGFVGFLFFIGIIVVRITCISGLRERNAELARRRNENRSLDGSQSPRSIQLSRIRGRVSRIRGQDGEGDPVQLVLLSLLENNLAFAKETIQDNHKDFEYLVPGENDRVADKLRECVNNNDWRSTRDALSQIEDNDTRSYYFSIIEDEIEKSWPEERTQNPGSFSPMLDEWLENEPDVTCHILRAEVGVSWAWHARSSALAFLVSSRQWELCHSRLESAAAEIEAAKALCPSDALIYATAITIKMGLGDRNDNIMTVGNCLDALNGIANDSLLRTAHIRAQKYYCEKWHGSHRQMFSHARDVTSQLPDGHPLWVLIPMAHVERTMIESVPGYWERPSVLREIQESYLRAFPGEAAHTIQATDPAALSRELTDRNYFAYALAATGQHEDARRQVRIIGRRPAKIWPWRTIGRYKQIVEALGFDVDPPNRDDVTCHLTHAVATPVGEGADAIPVATGVEIV